MSDFDFEELDKAVTGALATSKDGPATPSAVKEEEPSAFMATPMAEEPVQSTVIDTPKPTVSEPVKTAPVSAPAARRATGRFMDVVHPSSDMRTVSSPVNKTATSALPAEVKPQPTFQPVKHSLFSDDELETDFELSPIGPIDTTSALETPFLADAKVEKRPLGGSPNAASSLHLSVFDQPKTTLLEAPDEPLIEEHIEESTPAETFSFTDEPVETTIENPTPEVEHLDIEPVIEPTPPASIAQQYTEQPREEANSGAIYDTEAYHQPLVDAKKKSSGVWLAVWIVVLALIGAGAGLAFYFFILPAL